MISEERLRQLAALPEPRGEGRTFGGQRRPDVTEVLLIRHAHVPRSEASQDVSLTDEGREQAEVLAAFLAREQPLDAVFASPYKRTRETAEPIAGHQALAVEVWDDLRELESYVPEGKSLRQHLGEATWRAMQERMSRERRFDARPFTESSASVRRRAAAAIDHAIERHVGGRVAVVSHAPVISAYVATVLDCPIDVVFSPRLASISIVWAKDGLRSLRVLNATVHFGVL